MRSATVALVLLADLVLASAHLDTQSAVPEVGGRRSLQQTAAPRAGDLALFTSGTGSTRATGPSGVLKIFYNNGWAPVCDDNWEGAQGLINAKIACQQMGYAGVAINGVQIGSYSPNDPEYFFGLDDVACRGNEATLTQCPHLEPRTAEDCQINEVLRLTCTAPVAQGALRLVNGTTTATAANGTLQVWWTPSGQWPRWAPVCDDFWDTVEGSGVVGQNGRANAVVACKTINSAYVSGQALLGNRFNNSDNDFGLDDLRCPSPLSTFAACTKPAYGTENCVASEAIALSCSTRAAGDLALYTSTTGSTASSTNSGVLKVFYNNGWSPVCDDRWEGVQGYTNGRIACQQMGWNNATDVRIGYYNPNDPEYFFGLDDVACTGRESRLDACPHLEPRTAEDCQVNESLTVTCSL